MLIFFLHTTTSYYNYKQIRDDNKPNSNINMMLTTVIFRVTITKKKNKKRDVYVRV